MRPSGGHSMSRTTRVHVQHDEPFLVSSSGLVAGERVSGMFVLEAVMLLLLLLLLMMMVKMVRGSVAVWLPARVSTQVCLRKFLVTTNFRLAIAVQVDVGLECALGGRGAPPGGALVGGGQLARKGPPSSARLVDAHAAQRVGRARPQVGQGGAQVAPRLLGVGEGGPRAVAVGGTAQQDAPEVAETVAAQTGRPSEAGGRELGKHGEGAARLSASLPLLLLLLLAGGSRVGASGGACCSSAAGRAGAREGTVAASEQSGSKSAAHQAGRSCEGALRVS